MLPPQLHPYFAIKFGEQFWMQSVRSRSTSRRTHSEAAARFRARRFPVLHKRFRAGCVTVVPDAIHAHATDTGLVVPQLGPGHPRHRRPDGPHTAPNIDNVGPGMVLVVFGELGNACAGRAIGELGPLYNPPFPGRAVRTKASIRWGRSAGSGSRWGCRRP